MTFLGGCVLLKRHLSLAALNAKAADLGLSDASAVTGQ